MTYPFPWQPFDCPLFALHAIAATVAIGCIAGMWLLRRRASRTDTSRIGSRRLRPGVVCGVVGLVGGGSCAAASSQSKGQEFFFYCLTFTAVVAVAGLRHGLNRRDSPGVASDIWMEVSVVLLMGTGLLMALPQVGDARESADQSLCRQQVKDIAYAMYAWHDANDRLPDSAASVEGGPEVSWRVRVLDYADHGPASDLYDPQQPWDSDANLAAAQQRLDLYRCPANPRPLDELGRQYSAYAMPTGPDTVFPNGQGLRLSEIPSQSSTMMIVEACGLNIVWTEPRDVSTVEQSVGVNLPGRTPGASSGWLSSYHSGVGITAMADGSITSISDQIDPNVLRAMMTVDPRDDDNKRQ